MNYSIHENGWTVLLHEDLKKLSAEEAKEVCRLIVSNMVVVCKNQHMTPEEELQFCSKIGSHGYYPDGDDRVKHIRLNDGILRVTGKKDQYGKEGLFGHVSTLDWHANQPSNTLRKPLIWLYGKEGTKGSRTSWINNIKSYEALPEELKLRIDDIKIQCGYKSGNYSPSTFFNEHINHNNSINLVQVNKEGKEGLFFPFLQTFGFEGYPEKEFVEIMDLLKQHVVREEFMYHHDWEDNDVVISEQWLSVHKRWEFQNMENRVLHRIAFDYEKVYQ